MILNETAQNILIGTLLCGACFVFGRLSAPSVSCIQPASTQEQGVHEDTTVHEVVANDGTKTTETHTVSEIAHKESVAAVTQEPLSSTSGVGSFSPMWEAGVLASYDRHYGGYASHSFIGPVSLGLVFVNSQFYGIATVRF